MRRSSLLSLKLSEYISQLIDNEASLNNRRTSTNNDKINKANLRQMTTGICRLITPQQRKLDYTDWIHNNNLNKQNEKPRNKRFVFTLVATVFLAIGSGIMMNWLFPTRDLPSTAYNDVDKAVVKSLKDLSSYQSAQLKHDLTQDKRITKLERNQIISGLIKTLSDAKEIYIDQPDQIVVLSLEDVLYEFENDGYLNSDNLANHLKTLSPVLSSTVALGRHKNSTLCQDSYLLARSMLFIPTKQTYKPFETSPTQAVMQIESGECIIIHRLGALLHDGTYFTPSRPYYKDCDTQTAEIFAISPYNNDTHSTQIIALTTIVIQLICIDGKTMRRTDQHVTLHDNQTIVPHLGCHVKIIHRNRLIADSPPIKEKDEDNNYVAHWYTRGIDMYQETTEDTRHDTELIDMIKAHQKLKQDNDHANKLIKLEEHTTNHYVMSGVTITAVTVLSLAVLYLLWTRKTGQSTTGSATSNGVTIQNNVVVSDLPNWETFPMAPSLELENAFVPSCPPLYPTTVNKRDNNKTDKKSSII